jgi:hypothetical protein
MRNGDGMGWMENGWNVGWARWDVGWARWEGIKLKFIDNVRSILCDITTSKGKATFNIVWSNT